MTPEEQKPVNLRQFVENLKHNPFSAMWLTSPFLVFAMPKPQTFREQLKDEFKRQGWNW